MRQDVDLLQDHGVDRVAAVIAALRKYWYGLSRRSKAEPCRDDFRQSQLRCICRCLEQCLAYPIFDCKRQALVVMISKRIVTQVNTVARVQSPQP